MALMPPSSTDLGGSLRSLPSNLSWSRLDSTPTVTGMAIILLWSSERLCRNVSVLSHPAVPRTSSLCDSCRLISEVSSPISSGMRVSLLWQKDRSVRRVHCPTCKGISEIWLWSSDSSIRHLHSNRLGGTSFRRFPSTFSCSSVVIWWMKGSIRGMQLNDRSRYRTWSARSGSTQNSGGNIWSDILGSSHMPLSLAAAMRFQYFRRVGKPSVA
mmetsp:Transcript_60829/g.146405  ORF Transcript_60829/g.146405 Transcript_60829/m.146405 type:complete len:213 (+) Transcript_60829:774-1412(+)